MTAKRRSTRAGTRGSGPSRAPRLNTYSLFSGIAGVEVGLQRSGAAELSAFCENWSSAQDVLRARFPGTAIDDDVTALEDLRGAELVTPGFPCTDISQAGRTLGLDGLQSVLVLEVPELVQKRRPAWLPMGNGPSATYVARPRCGACGCRLMADGAGVVSHAGTGMLREVADLTVACQHDGTTAVRTVVP